MPHSPPRPANSTAALNALWHETSSAAEFLDPTALPLSKVHRAWERQPQSPFKKGRGTKKVWRRYETIENKIRSQPDNGTVRVVKKQCIGDGETVDTREEVEHFDERRKPSKATRTERKDASPRKRRIPRRRSSAVATAMPKLDLEQHTFPPQEEVSRPRSPVGRTLEEEEEDKDEDDGIEGAKPEDVHEQAYTTPRRSSRTRDIVMGTPRSASFKFGSHTPVTLDDLDTYGNLYRDHENTGAQSSDGEESDASSEEMLEYQSHISRDTATEQSFLGDEALGRETPESEIEEELTGSYNQDPSLELSDTNGHDANENTEYEHEEEAIEPEGMSTIFEEPEGESTMLHCDEEPTITSLSHNVTAAEVPVMQQEAEPSTLGLSIFDTEIGPPEQRPTSHERAQEQETEQSTLGLSLFDTKIQPPSPKNQTDAQNSTDDTEQSSLGFSMFDTASEAGVGDGSPMRPVPTEADQSSLGLELSNSKIPVIEGATRKSTVSVQNSSGQDDEEQCADPSTLGLSMFDAEDTVTIEVTPEAHISEQQDEEPEVEQLSLGLDIFNTEISTEGTDESVESTISSAQHVHKVDALEPTDVSKNDQASEETIKLPVIDGNTYSIHREADDSFAIEQADVKSVEDSSEAAPALEELTPTSQEDTTTGSEEVLEMVETETQTSAATAEEQPSSDLMLFEEQPSNTITQPIEAEDNPNAMDVDVPIIDRSSITEDQVDATETLVPEDDSEQPTTHNELVNGESVESEEEEDEQEEADTTEHVITPTRPSQARTEDSEELVAIELGSNAVDDNDETTTVHFQALDAMDTSHIPDKTNQNENAVPDIADGLTLQFSRQTSAEPGLPKTPDKTVISRIERLPDEITMELQEDTAILKDFLSRAAASKANRSATISRRESASNRRDSDAIKHALASPRKVLEDKDPNSPFPEKKHNPSKTAPSSPSAKDLLAQDPEVEEEADEEKTQEVTVPSTRRSTRARSSRIPPPSTLPTPSRISIRAPSQEPVVPKKSEAQELAQLTRNNTRRNKGTAVSALTRLKKLEIEHALDTPESSTTVNVVVAQKPGRRIRWDEQLAYFQDADGKSVQLPSALPLTTLLAAEKDILEKSDLDAAPAASTSNKRKSRDSLSAGSSTPKARRLRGLGTANGTPAKGLLTPASSLLPDTQDENTLSLSSAAKESLLPAAAPPAKPAKSRRASKAKASSASSDAPLPPASLPAQEVQAKTPTPAAEPAEAKPKERRSRLAAPKKVVLPGAGATAKTTTTAATEEAKAETKGMEATAVRRRGRRGL